MKLITRTITAGLGAAVLAVGPLSGPAQSDPPPEGVRAGATITTPPPWVHDSVGGVAVSENDGSLLAADHNAIGPFSISSWIAQGNGLPGVLDRRNGVELHQINGVVPYFEATPGDEMLNTAVPVARTLHNVMAYDEVRTGGTDPVLRIAFNGSNSQTCTATTDGQATITLYGFGSLGSGCGVILESLRAFPNG